MVRRVLLAAAVLMTTRQSMPGQPALSMPPWLASYPGATPETRTHKDFIESSYKTAAKPDEVIAYYGKLFESANLPFQPNFDGTGTSIRAAAAECDLLIAVREQDAGTLVRMSCAAKSTSSPAAPEVTVVTGPRSTLGSSPARPAPSARSPQPIGDHQAAVDRMMEQHKKAVADLGIHRVYQDADAPPLAWPSWLTHVRGATLAAHAGVDQSKERYLKATYVTSVPMTEIYGFYKELLRAHDYPVHGASLSTGQTSSGVMQNADGYVEGTNYPNGHPGPRTVIKVNFSRWHLNDPITVDVRFTTYAFVAPKHTIN